MLAQAGKNEDDTKVLLLYLFSILRNNPQKFTKNSFH